MEVNQIIVTSDPFKKYPYLPEDIVVHVETGMGFRSLKSGEYIYRDGATTKIW